MLSEEMACKIWLFFFWRICSIRAEWAQLCHKTVQNTENTSSFCFKKLTVSSGWFSSLRWTLKLQISSFNAHVYVPRSSMQQLKESVHFLLQAFQQMSFLKKCVESGVGGWVGVQMPGARSHATFSDNEPCRAGEAAADVVCCFKSLLALFDLRCSRRAQGKVE